ncbi:MAG: 5-formyltetrahydrofolate cyclo-ligase [Caulobacteraceae bacterium]
MRRPSPEPGGAAWRKAERKRLIEARLAMAPADRRDASAAIERVLSARFAPGAFPLLGAYWPIRGEFDPLPYLRRAILAGGEVALPVALAAGAPLEFRLWTPETPMTAGEWDILHPAHGAPMIPDALLAPLVGFDAAGHRLGYGGGYYDRTLAAMSPRPLAIGVGFEIGRLAHLPPAAHDRPMDLIVTEAGAFDRP